VAGERLLSKPIAGIAVCCARAASGHAARLNMVVSGTGHPDQKQTGVATF
jgi:hypothetical protein